MTCANNELGPQPVTSNRPAVDRSFEKVLLVQNVKNHSQNIILEEVLLFMAIVTLFFSLPNFTISNAEERVSRRNKE